MVSASVTENAGDKHLPSGSRYMLRKEGEGGNSLLNDSVTEEVERILLNEREWEAKGSDAVSRKGFEQWNIQGGICILKESNGLPKGCHIHVPSTLLGKADV